MNEEETFMISSGVNSGFLMFSFTKSLFEGVHSYLRENDSSGSGMAVSRESWLKVISSL